jgi:hypothetical protein
MAIDLKGTRFLFATSGYTCAASALMWHRSRGRSRALVAFMVGTHPSAVIAASSPYPRSCHRHGRCTCSHRLTEAVIRKQ